MLSCCILKSLLIFEQGDPHSYFDSVEPTNYVAIPELLLLLWPWGHWLFLIIGLISILKALMSSLSMVLGIWKMAFHSTLPIGSNWFSPGPLSHQPHWWFHNFEVKIVKYPWSVSCGSVWSFLSSGGTSLSHYWFSPSLLSLCSSMGPQSIQKLVVSPFHLGCPHAIQTEEDPETLVPCEPWLWPHWPALEAPRRPGVMLGACITAGSTLTNITQVTRASAHCQPW